MLPKPVVWPVLQREPGERELIQRPLHSQRLPLLKILGGECGLFSCCLRSEIHFARYSIGVRPMRQQSGSRAKARDYVLAETWLRTSESRALARVRLTLVSRAFPRRQQGLPIKQCAAQVDA